MFRHETFADPNPKEPAWLFVSGQYVCVPDNFKEREAHLLKSGDSIHYHRRFRWSANWAVSVGSEEPSPTVCLTHLDRFALRCKDIPVLGSFQGNSIP
jgi:hypothetical protein